MNAVAVLPSRFIKRHHAFLAVQSIARTYVVLSAVVFRLGRNVREMARGTSRFVLTAHHNFWSDYAAHLDTMAAQP